MAKILLEFLHRVGVADRGVGVYCCGGAAVDAVLHDHPGIADGQGFAEPVEFGPRGDVVDIDIGAEAAFVARCFHGGLQGAQ